MFGSRLPGLPDGVEHAVRVVEASSLQSQKHLCAHQWMSICACLISATESLRKSLTPDDGRPARNRHGQQHTGDVCEKQLCETCNPQQETLYRTWVKGSMRIRYEATIMAEE